MEAPQQELPVYQTSPNEDVVIEDQLRVLIDPSEELFKKVKSNVVSIMNKQQGECLYEIGTDSSGTPVGLNEDEYNASVENLNLIAESLSATMSLVVERYITSELKAGIFNLRSHVEDVCIDVRYAVCGNVDSGKSTLIGVLCKGRLDDGRGSMRVAIFNHKHEIETGRTSSIGQEIVGFDEHGASINTKGHHALSWGEIIEHSKKVLSFLDLAGHEKYLKTTVSGMTGNMPDYCLLLIGANMGVTRMTKEHLGLALALKIPLIVVITKIDLAPENILKQTLSDIQRILKTRGVRKIPLVIRNEEQLMTALRGVTNDRLVPIVLISNVSGENIDMLRNYLNAAPPRIHWDALYEQPPEVLIDQTYFVTGVGTVVGGTVMAGVVNANQTMLLGPDGNGHFNPVSIKTIHCKKVPVSSARAGQSGGFALRKIKRSMIRKGMVLVHPDSNPKAVWTFQADVIILFHSTTIHTNYQPVVQCMTMRQSAKITEIHEKEVLRTRDRAKVSFRFLYRPEFIKVGMRLIFREGRCKGIGIISRINLEEDLENEYS
eukprot:TRINITY_DN8036_c0_g1_i1.p1 TRINITY_DN8036_c0_g1~~TRINITY_DN8036_c0_g1_i1.p1  ORF type:complete len:557 (-),score=107.60 TRINITY_DN8036_c0_g1_i1:21-1661(-)